MSERGKRVFRFLLDQERDADVIGRIEAQSSMTGYVRELVRRDVHDERLDFAALKASELQADNAKLRELVRDYERCTMHADCDKCEYDGKMSMHCPMSPCFPDSDELHELGVEV